mmetsp:Transcript_560/g.1844  ORF Transcript_560/g.1844 Transcript_560/m.1844 type:complete len:227 (+) Transcript_560:1784-2464(+)
MRGRHPDGGGARYGERRAEQAVRGAEVEGEVDRVHAGAAREERGALRAGERAQRRLALRQLHPRDQAEQQRRAVGHELLPLLEPLAQARRPVSRSLAEEQRQQDHHQQLGEQRRGVDPHVRDLQQQREREGHCEDAEQVRRERQQQRHRDVAAAGADEGDARVDGGRHGAEEKEADLELGRQEAQPGGEQREQRRDEEDGDHAKERVRPRGERALYLVRLERQAGD